MFHVTHPSFRMISSLAGRPDNSQASYNGTTSAGLILWVRRLRKSSAIHMYNPACIQVKNEVRKFSAFASSEKLKRMGPFLLINGKGWTCHDCLNQRKY